MARYMTEAILMASQEQLPGLREQAGLSDCGSGPILLSLQPTRSGKAMSFRAFGQVKAIRLNNTLTTFSLVAKHIAVLHCGRKCHLSYLERGVALSQVRTPSAAATVPPNRPAYLDSVYGINSLSSGIPWSFRHKLANSLAKSAQLPL